MTRRTISPVTLARVEAPDSTPALRAFHAASLADIRARAARQAEPVRGNSFERYIEKLNPRKTKP